MGLDYNGVRLAAYTKAIDPGLQSVAMLGRQSLHTDAPGIGRVFDEFDIPYEETDARRIVEEGGGYCEPLMKYLGFGTVESFDFSGYESPTHVHDFNRPIPAEFERRYDLVLDGGSLEHIFNFPIALRNCMSMVRPGGLFVTITPCNNLSGHGFYQFSPELYFSLMRGGNGYQLLDLFCHEYSFDMNWYSPKDPNIVKSRIGLTTRKPVMMLVVARRVCEGDLPEFHPQQSDYQTIWSGETPESSRENAGGNSRPSIQSRVRRIAALAFPARLRAKIRNLFEPERFPPALFTPVGTAKSSLAGMALMARRGPGGSDGANQA